MKRVIWVGYTTLYREGGARFRQVAQTLARELAAPGEASVRLCQIESKRDFLAEMARLAPGSLSELHLVAHGGMYGPMFGSREWPEQFSRHEWSRAELPFAPAARAYFHTCRSARWFAPFFAQVFGVETFGYHWYTTFSQCPKRFVWVPPAHPEGAPLYVFGCPGRKSHGWLGVAGKYSGLVAPEPMRRYGPERRVSAGYDPVARLYDAAFQDIRVRADEWRWLEQRVRADRAISLLDLGCGNGALLCQLAPRLERGIGVDASPEMVALARANAERRGYADRLRFESVSGPELPVADQSIDYVVSLLSFRYLDWDPMVAEVRRVLKPAGRWLVVDMVASPFSFTETPALLRGKWRALRAARRFKGYRGALARLVKDPDWQSMLQYNPMRAEHEFSWYLSSRFPQGRLEVINVALKSKVLAFDSGPIASGSIDPGSMDAEMMAAVASARSGR